MTGRRALRSARWIALSAPLLLAPAPPAHAQPPGGHTPSADRAAQAGLAQTPAERARALAREAARAFSLAGATEAGEDRDGLVAVSLALFDRLLAEHPDTPEGRAVGAGRIGSIDVAALRREAEDGAARRRETEDGAARRREALDGAARGAPSLSGVQKVPDGDTREAALARGAAQIVCGGEAEGCAPVLAAAMRVWLGALEALAATEARALLLDPYAIASSADRLALFEALSDPRGPYLPLLAEAIRAQARDGSLFGLAARALPTDARARLADALASALVTRAAVAALGGDGGGAARGPVAASLVDEAAGRAEAGRPDEGHAESPAEIPELAHRSATAAYATALAERGAPAAPVPGDARPDPDLSAARAHAAAHRSIMLAERPTARPGFPDAPPPSGPARQARADVAGR